MTYKNKIVFTLDRFLKTDKKGLPVSPAKDRPVGLNITPERGACMSENASCSQPSATIVTNDLYLAAFLHCVGCTLDHAEKNERRRVSFVFVGERVRELREAYRTGPVRLDMRSFRESLIHIRRLIDGEQEQRSVSHASTRLSSSELSPCCLQPHATV
jgi:hypothetical protein